MLPQRVINMIHSGESVNFVCTIKYFVIVRGTQMVDFEQNIDLFPISLALP